MITAGYFALATWLSRKIKSEKRRVYFYMAVAWLSVLTILLLSAFLIDLVANVAGCIRPPDPKQPCRIFGFHGQGNASSSGSWFALAFFLGLGWTLAFGFAFAIYAVIDAIRVFVVALRQKKYRR